MLPFTAQHFGNPSSNSAFSAGCRAAIDEARRHAAALIDADPDDIIFTASGTQVEPLAPLCATALPPHWVLPHCLDCVGYCRAA